MPATDKEIDAQKTPPPGQTKENKNSRDWESAGQGSKFTAPDPAVADKIMNEILAGGRESLVELIGLVRDPAGPDFKNYKAEYLCHCLTIRLGRPEQDASRRFYVDTLASQITGGKLSVYARGFLVRELQWIGDAPAMPAVARLLTDETLCADAARTLLAIGGGVAAPLLSALPGVPARCRLILFQSLAAVADASSLPALREAAADADRDVRLAAGWGLARMGDAGAAELLLKAADMPPSFARTQAARACLLLADNLAGAGKKKEAANIYTRLHDTRTGPKERYLRDLAAKALEALGPG